MRRFLAPEVIQTSGMDCGPASLKSLLEGFGINASYGRLREACQTSLDGSSIDTIEEAAVQLGLDAEQIMIPQDHLYLNSAKALPALIVTRLPNGNTHFVVLWRQIGGWVVTMDPGVGTNWMTKAAFLRTVYHHQHPVPADAWREWAGTDEFLHPLIERCNPLKIDTAILNETLAKAQADPAWHGLAVLDATVRMLTELVKTGALQRGEEATRAFQNLYQRATASFDEALSVIPPSYWLVLHYGEDEETGEVYLLLRGAVLMRVKGVANPNAADTDIAPELKAALQERPTRLWHDIWGLLRRDTPAWLIPVVVALGVLAGIMRLVEGLVITSFTNQGASNLLGFDDPFAPILGLLVAALLLEIATEGSTADWGRRLDYRLRHTFYRKLPRLGDRYFSSRLGSDMAERAHAVQALGTVPSNLLHLIKTSIHLLATGIALGLLYPPAAIWIVAAIVVLTALLLISHVLIIELNLRVITMSGIASRHQLDAMRGLLPIRAHNAERVMRREFEGLQDAFRRAWLQLHTRIIVGDSLITGFAYGVAILFMAAYTADRGVTDAYLLVAYWAVALSFLGQQFYRALYDVSIQRSTYARLIEPLGALEEETPLTTLPDNLATPTDGVSIAMQHVSVVITGNTILDDVSLSIGTGEHVAIIGRSGAGKSSLVGLLLGWYRPVSGSLLVDGQPLSAERLPLLRSQSAWVDPSVYLWNRSLEENLLFGNIAARSQHTDPLAFAQEQADLISVLEKLPEGFATKLGEAGGLVSGGEGQRVRLGRAILRQQPRLVILDEPFRGLDRPRREQLLKQARTLWKQSTLLCVTHDISETHQFDRVLVIEGGRVIEDGPPEQLAADPASHYHHLLQLENTAQAAFRQSDVWRMLWLENGQLGNPAQPQGVAS